MCEISGTLIGGLGPVEARWTWVKPSSTPTLMLIVSLLVDIMHIIRSKSIIYNRINN